MPSPKKALAQGRPTEHENFHVTDRLTLYLLGDLHCHRLGLVIRLCTQFNIWRSLAILGMMTPFSI